MADPTPEQLAANWNQVARRYADHIDPMTALYAADAVELAGVSSDDRVLDVASGAGAATVIAARRAKEVVAADFSSEMVAALRERADREGLTNVTVEEMDAQDLGFDDGTFDAAISVFGVMIVPDRARSTPSSTSGAPRPWSPGLTSPPVASAEGCGRQGRGRA